MRITILFCLTILLFSCVNKPEKTCVANCNGETTKVTYAKHFRFVQSDGKELLEIINPDSKKVMCSLVPFSDNKQVIALSGTFIGMMNQLNLIPNIVGVSEIKYVYNPEVLKGYENGSVLECGYDSQMKIESMIAKRPQAIFHSGYNQDFPHQKQFENVGVHVIPIYDWREESPLGKAEWIKVYGFLLGKMEEANEVYTNIVTSYNQMKDQAQALNKSQLLMSGNIIGSEWCAPAGNSFLAQIMKDANILYSDATTEGSGSVMSTIEDMVAKNRYASYWVNPGSRSLSELKQQNPKAVLFEAFQSKNVFCYLNNDSYYWEESSIKPHLLLSDYIHIAHPELGKQDELHFYQRLK